MDNKIFNAAILVYRNSILPGILDIFSLPKLENLINVTVEDCLYNILIISYPVYDGDTNSKRKNKIIAKICKDNDVKFIVEKLDEWECVNKREYIKLNFDKSNYFVKSICAVKDYSAIIKLSEVLGKKILTKSIGFITQNIAHDKLDLFSDEAESIMLYENSVVDIKMKSKIYSELMNKKGISIIFSKDIEKIIQNSAILIIDEGIDLAEYEAMLKGKIIIGRNSVRGDFAKIENVLLWMDKISDLSYENHQVKYNNEILAIIKYFDTSIKSIDFIKKFPYIYLYNEQNQWNGISSVQHVKI